MLSVHQTSLIVLVTLKLMLAGFLYYYCSESSLYYYSIHGGGDINEILQRIRYILYALLMCSFGLITNSALFGKGEPNYIFLIDVSVYSVFLSQLHSISAVPSREDISHIQYMSRLSLGFCAFSTILFYIIKKDQIVKLSASILKKRD